MIPKTPNHQLQEALRQIAEIPEHLEQITPAQKKELLSYIESQKVNILSGVNSLLIHNPQLNFEDLQHNFTLGGFSLADLAQLEALIRQSLEPAKAPQPKEPERKYNLPAIALSEIYKELAGEPSQILIEGKAEKLAASNGYKSKNSGTDLRNWYSKLQLERDRLQWIREPELKQRYRFVFELLAKHPKALQIAESEQSEILSLKK